MEGGPQTIGVQLSAQGKLAETSRKTLFNSAGTQVEAAALGKPSLGSMCLEEKRKALACRGDPGPRPL